MNSMELVGLIACLIALVFIGKSIGEDIGREELQDELVNQGKAEYYLDDDNERQWRMK